MVAANGGQRRRITAWGQWTTSARWSPDARWIAFDEVNRPHGDHDLFLFLVHPDGLGTRLIAHSRQAIGDVASKGRCLWPNCCLSAIVR